MPPYASPGVAARWAGRASFVRSADILLSLPDAVAGRVAQETDITRCGDQPVAAFNESPPVGGCARDAAERLARRSHRGFRAGYEVAHVGLIELFEPANRTGHVVDTEKRHIDDGDGADLRGALDRGGQFYLNDQQNFLVGGLHVGSVAAVIRRPHERRGIASRALRRIFAGPHRGFGFLRRLDRGDHQRVSANVENLLDEDRVVRRRAYDARRAERTDGAEHVEAQTDVAGSMLEIDDKEIEPLKSENLGIGRKSPLTQAPNRMSPADRRRFRSLVWAIRSVAPAPGGPLPAGGMAERRKSPPIFRI